MRIYRELFDKIVSPENLFLAWEAFRRDKRNKQDVQGFERNLEQNIFQLSRDLRAGNYRHGTYEGFFISDPKRRHIHKAKVRDRVLHHAIFQSLNPIFEPTFISNSFSCRVGKGSHKGVKALRSMINKESRNSTEQCYVLKCDVKKFFDSVNHSILLSVLKRKIKDTDTVKLLEHIVGSYASKKRDLFHDTMGIPIGNLTSQLFANIYMNEFDQFVKHKLKVRHYGRYTDDFVIVSRDKDYLRNLVSPITDYLKKNLVLDLHPQKVEILSYTRGVDFLGYVIFPHHTLVRKRTKNRIFYKFRGRIKEYKRKEIEEEKVMASLRSYLGVLSHADAHDFSMDLKNYFWFMKNS